MTDNCGDRYFRKLCSVSLSILNYTQFCIRENFQAMQMDQSSLYSSQRFGGDGGSSVVGVLGGRGQMRPRRRGCWWIGKQRQGTSSFSYRPRLTVRGQHNHMLLHVCPNRGGGVFSCWWRLTILVAAHSAGGGGGGKKGSWRKL